MLFWECDLNALSAAVGLRLTQVIVLLIRSGPLLSRNVLINIECLSFLLFVVMIKDGAIRWFTNGSDLSVLNVFVRPITTDWVIGPIRAE